MRISDWSSDVCSSDLDDSRDCGRRPTADAATCILHAGDIAVAETSRLRACVIHAECDPKGLLRGATRLGRTEIGQEHTACRFDIGALLENSVPRQAEPAHVA